MAARVQGYLLGQERKGMGVKRRISVLGDWYTVAMTHDATIIMTRNKAIVGAVMRLLIEDKHLPGPSVTLQER